MATFGNDGIDMAVVSITYVDVDTPTIKAFSPLIGNFPVMPSLMPGGVWSIPSVGEQWLVHRLDHAWFLHSRAAFQDPKMNLRGEEGTTGLGSSGPTYIIGNKVYVGNDHHDLLEIIADLQQRIADLESGQS